MRVVALLTVLAACSPAPDSATHPTSYASTPSAQWPCAIETRNADTTERFQPTYTRSSCRVPVQLIARGVWGCPDRIDRTTLTYDGSGRLKKLTTGDSVDEFWWAGNKVASIHTPSAMQLRGNETDQIAYRERDDGYELVGGGMLLVEKDARLVEIRTFVVDPNSPTGATRIEWDGDRPTRVLDAENVIGTTSTSILTFVYECPR
jgi:hypothetical protein